MRSRVRALRRPVHPMLVMFLVALFITGSIFDVIHLFTDNATLAEVGFWCIGVGLVGAVLTGLADWSKISHGTRARSVGVRHFSSTPWYSSRTSSVGPFAWIRPITPPRRHSSLSNWPSGGTER